MAKIKLSVHSVEVTVNYGLLNDNGKIEDITYHNPNARHIANELTMLRKLMRTHDVVLNRIIIYSIKSEVNHKFVRIVKEE